MSNIYATEDELALSNLHSQLEKLLKKCHYYNNRKVVKISEETEFSFTEKPLNEMEDNTKHAYHITITLNQDSTT